MIYPGQPIPDLLPLEPPEYGRFREEPDEDYIYECRRDEDALDV